MHDSGISDILTRFSNILLPVQTFHIFLCHSFIYLIYITVSSITYSIYIYIYIYCRHFVKDFHSVRVKSPECDLAVIITDYRESSHKMKYDCLDWKGKPCYPTTLINNIQN